MNILDLLEINEVVNFLDAGTKFDQQFIDHYMRARFKIDKKIIYIPTYHAQKYDKGAVDIISLDNGSIAAQFLRNVGHLIRKIEVDTHIHYIDTIAQHIETYCSKTLRELTLIGSNNHFLSKSNQSLANLTKLSLTLPIRGEENAKVSQIFPNLEELSIIGKTDPTEIYHFMEYLHYTRDLEDYSKNILDVVQSSPPLRKLFVEGLPLFKAFQSILDHQQHVESLAIGYDVDILKKIDVGLTYQFNNLRYLSLDITDYSKGEEAKPFPIRCNQLENLEIRTTNFSHIPYGMIQDSIALKSLSFPTWNKTEGLLELLDGIKETHSIEDISIVWSNTIEENYTKRLLNDYPNLKKIVFSLYHTWTIVDDRDALVNLIATESGTNNWRVANAEILPENNGPHWAYVTVVRDSQ